MTKTISLADDAYEALRRLKREGESFSELARRLARGKRQDRILELAGAWSDMDDAEGERFKAQIRKWRDESAEPRVRLD